MLYTQEDINVFRTLSNQAALAIENCIFLEEFKKTQERLFNAEKLASIGGMADGVAHQIKNRLNQFSLASGEMKCELDDLEKSHKEQLERDAPLRKSVEYFREIAESIASNVKKTSMVIQGILNYARTEEKATYFSEFPLSDVVAQSVELLKVKHQLAQFPLVVEANGDDVVYGVKAQVMESVYNQLDNSYEAIKEKMDYHLAGEEKKRFNPSIRLKVSQKERASLIEIEDNGIGIKDENRLKVFTAFFTTKPSSKSGSGIGAYVVKRMIEENHKGKIWFKSEYGRGTTFYIELPKNKRTDTIVQ